jgi:hypothetical protein
MIVELPAEKHTRGIDSGAPYPTLAGWPHSAEDQARRVYRYLLVVARRQYAA